MSDFLLSWTCLFRSLRFLSYAGNVILLACYEILLCVSPLASFIPDSSTYLFVNPTLRRPALVSAIGLGECSLLIPKGLAPVPGYAGVTQVPWRGSNLTMVALASFELAKRKSEAESGLISVTFGHFF